MQGTIIELVVRKGDVAGGDITFSIWSNHSLEILSGRAGDLSNLLTVLPNSVSEYAHEMPLSVLVPLEQVQVVEPIIGDNNIHIKLQLEDNGNWRVFRSSPWREKPLESVVPYKNAGTAVRLSLSGDQVQMDRWYAEEVAHA